MDERYEDGYDPEYGYNRNAFMYKTPQTGLLSRVVKLVTTPIALASEAIAHNQQKGEKDTAFVELPQDQANALIESGHAVPADGAEPTHELVGPDERDDDEADWALDEAAEDIVPERESSSVQLGEEGSEPSVEALMAPIKSPAYTPMHQPSGKAALPFPVVLPQRRPRTKTRGFVRAYAPVLADLGIDQTSFLEFLNALHKAAQAHPVFDIIQIGTALAGLYPDPIIGLSIQAAQIIAAAAAEVQERWTTNKFLEQANKDIFVPRGLYCMIVSYMPGGAEEVGQHVVKKTVDLAAPAVAMYGDHLTKKTSAESAGKVDEMKEKARTRLHVASGETTGEAELPVNCAPLIYPALERAGARRALDEDQANSRRMDQKTMEFVGDYFDRRARMIEATKNPDGTLTNLSGGKPGFASNMGDPNDGRNRHFITLLSGGKIKAEPLGGKRRWEKAKRKENERIMQGLKTNPKKRMLQENILYLVIVNMPEKADIERAKAELKAKEGKEKGA